MICIFFITLVVDWKKARRWGLDLILVFTMLVGRIGPTPRVRVSLVPSDIAGEVFIRQRTLLDNFCSDRVILLLTLSSSCFASFAFRTEVLSRMRCLSPFRARPVTLLAIFAEIANLLNCETTPGMCTRRRET